MFSDESEFEELSQCKKDIQDTMKEIRDHRREVRLALRMPSLDYTTVLGTEVRAQSLFRTFRPLAVYSLVDESSDDMKLSQMQKKKKEKKKIK